MARDGRMRALVMDESITPLLYRVNGMYKELGISCVVVVGGVGDWLGKSSKGFSTTRVRTGLVVWTNQLKIHVLLELKMFRIK